FDAAVERRGRARGARRPRRIVCGRRRLAAQPAGWAARRGALVTRRRAALTLALFLLTVSLSFHNVWPTVLVTWRFELSLEITVLVAGLALWLELGRTVGRGALTAIALVLLVLCLGRYAEVTAPALYGRPVNLYWDAQHVPKVIAMLAHAAPPAIVAAGAAALVAALAGLFWVLRASVARVVAGMAAPKPRRVLGGGAAALAALYALGIAGVTAPSQHWFALPVT